MTDYLRLATIALVALLATTCIGASSNPTIAVNPSPPTTTQLGSGLNPQHVAAVLGPAVATVIVFTRKDCSTKDCVVEGSAFVIAHDGSASYLITNNHVIKDGQKIQVLMPDGRHFIATVRGTDALTDIAVLRVNDASLPSATFADSTKLQVGQPVVAIGSPLQQLGAITTGVVSALHRRITAEDGSSSENLPDAIQTDAAINPGNSGGPLADADGRVIGINTAAGTPTSALHGPVNTFGYAIPSAIVKRIGEAMMAGRKPGHPYIGLKFVEEAVALTGNEQDYPANAYGTLVIGVCPGQPGERAGIRPRDVIEKADTTDLRNGQTLGGILQLHEPGDRIRLTILRDGNVIHIDGTLIEAPTGGC